MPSDSPVAVVGGGVSGAMAARWLAEKHGRTVVLFESARGLGGRTRCEARK